jgi:outer membrane lipoprotein-sorting protein
MTIRSILAAAAIALSTTCACAADGKSAQELVSKLLSVRAATYDFVQFGPKGDQTTGRLKVRRPGRIRFEYQEGSPLLVVADGRSLAVHNSRLKTWNLYPLDKTPLGFMLAESFDPSKVKIVSNDVSGNITSVGVSDPAVFGDTSVRLVFDNADGSLKQWTVRDSRGSDTTVLLYNGREGGSFDGRDFEIPYTQIRTGEK